MLMSRYVTSMIRLCALINVLLFKLDSGN